MTEDELAAFEQDWADVTGGKYTIDEVAAGNDVQDLYYGYLSDPSILDTLGGVAKQFGTAALDGLKAMYTKDGKVDWKAVAATAGGLYGAYQASRPQEKTGYQGKIPKYEMVREAVPGSQYDPNRRPGSGGQRYFSDTTYAAPGEAATAARAAAKEQAAGLASLNAANPARIETVPVPKYAHGGITALARGRYLGGATDGMADKIPANIDGKQEAALSHGEFVIPADVVSHLGNGNSEAGAQRLYEMMDKIRKARTGSTKQGKQINPNKFLPS